MFDNCFFWGRREENGVVMDNKVILIRILYVFQRERERQRYRVIEIERDKGEREEVGERGVRERKQIQIEFQMCGIFYFF